MSAQYLLPCTCGKKVCVEPAQAGGQVACACGQKVMVPTLRALKQLELAKPDEAATNRAAGRGWSPLQGALFSIGLLVTAISLLVVLYSFRQMMAASEITEDRTPEINMMEGQMIDEMSLMDSIQAFEELRGSGLGEQQPPYWVLAQRIVVENRTLMLWSGGFAIAGILAVVASLFIRPTVPIRPTPASGRESRT